MPSSAKVAVIILNWNGWSDTVKCLESVLWLDEDVGVFVCDNASTDGSVNQINAWARDTLPDLNQRRAAAGRAPVRFSAHSPAADARSPADSNGVCQITLIETGGNLGFAGGNNVGLSQAMKDDYAYFWLINNDTVVDPAALTRLLDTVSHDPTIGICGSTLLYLDRPDLVQTWGGGGFKNLTGQSYALGYGKHREEPIDRGAIENQLRFVAGAAMLVTRPFLESIGLMEEGYFLYYEELDWAERGRGKYRLGYEPKSIVYHKVGASIGTDDGGKRSMMSEYYLSRNRIRFCARFSKVSLPFVFAELSRNVVRFSARRQWERAYQVFRAMIGLPFFIRSRAG
jgi:GT2 family glycosyltransferase